MIERILSNRLAGKLDTGKAIILTGPRQTLKTTLLRLIFSDMDDVLWLNGDDPETRMLLDDVTVTKWKRIIGTTKSSSSTRLRESTTLG